MKTKNYLVTKELLTTWVTKDPVKVIGKALVAIFKNQTSAEQHCNITRLQNGIGFTQADARIGSIGAKIFIRDGILPPWQLKHWAGINSKGELRILKYANQLNQIALAKKECLVKLGVNIPAQLSNMGIAPERQGLKMIEHSLTLIRP